MAVIYFFKILSTSDISVTFAFYNGLTKGNEVRFLRKILLVDNNNAITQELTKLLKRRGYGVQTAVTVAGAKEAIEKERPLFISSDLDLLDGSGLDLLHSQRNLAERYGALVKFRPLFILTDSRDPATEYQYRQEGVNDYLTSPVNIPELIRRIRYFIAPQEQIEAAE